MSNNIYDIYDHPLYNLIFSADVDGLRKYISKIDFKKGFKLDDLMPKSDYNMPWLNIISEYSYLPDIDNILFITLFIKHKFRKNLSLINKIIKNVILSIELSRMKHTSFKNIITGSKNPEFITKNIDSKLADLYLKKYENQLNQIIIILLKQGANINSINSLGETPLITSSISGDSKAVEILLAGGSKTKNVLEYIENQEIKDENRWRKSRGLIEDDEKGIDDDDEKNDIPLSNRIVYYDQKGFEKIRNMIKKSIRYDLNELEYEEEYEIDRIDKEIKHILSMFNKEERKEIEYNVKNIFIDISKKNFEELKQYDEELERLNFPSMRRRRSKLATFNPFSFMLRPQKR